MAINPIAPLGSQPLAGADFTPSSGGGGGTIYTEAVTEIMTMGDSKTVSATMSISLSESTALGSSATSRVPGPPSHGGMYPLARHRGRR